MPLYRFVYFIPLAVLGFKPVDILFMCAITQVYGILVHTQQVGKLPAWIEYIFVTPSHYRVHHACNVPYLDKNMGMALIIWDRLFNTFAEEQPNEPPVFGLLKQEGSITHPMKVVTHEWEAIHKTSTRLPWSLKLKYFLMPLGWSHNGSTQNDQTATG
jgi:sterol desaturase/sphingolipid hydroxylase (fatty acid hydroxylase superfamily)